MLIMLIIGVVLLAAAVVFITPLRVRTEEALFGRKKITTPNPSIETGSRPITWAADKATATLKGLLNEPGDTAAEGTETAPAAPPQEADPPASTP